MKVEDVLATKGTKVVTVRPDTPIVTVIHQMNIERVGAVVISRDGAHVLGMISERDIVQGLADRGAGLLQMHAADLMKHSLIVCAPEDGIKSVMSRMTAHRVRHLPVLERSALVGIISIGDAVKCRLEEIEMEAMVLRDAYIACR